MNIIKKSILSIFIYSIFCAFIFSSCSDSSPEILNCRSMVVLTYKNETDAPDMNFSAFVETSSDVRRVSSFTVENRANHYIWTVDSPAIFSGTNNKWAAGFNLRSSGDKKILTGTYDVEYIDARNKKVSGVMNLYYPEELIKMNLEEAKTFLDDKARNQIAVYDENGVMIYYGLRKDSWQGDNEVFAFNSGAVKFRTVYSSYDESYVVFSPFTIKKEKE